MKKRVLKEKKFLQRVYRSKNLKPVDAATVDQLKALLAAIHLVINKKVPITNKLAAEFLKLKKKTLDEIKRLFRNPKDLSQLFKLSRGEITKIIEKYFDQIKLALSSYFIKKEKTESDFVK